MINWNEIDTVLLDMDGTLLDLYFDNYFWQEYLPEKWAELNGMDIVSAKSRLMPRFRDKEGTLSWYCLDYWSGQLDVDILALKSGIEYLIKPRPQSFEFLEFISSQNKSLALVTNAHQDLIALKFEKTGIDRYFNHVFCAHDFGLPKEEEGFWKSLDGVYPFDPRRTLFIDDNLTVLRSARRHGIRHLLSIARPDSRKPARDCQEFIAVESFAQLCELETQ